MPYIYIYILAATQLIYVYINMFHLHTKRRIQEKVLILIKNFPVKTINNSLCGIHKKTQRKTKWKIHFNQLHYHEATQKNCSYYVKVYTDTQQYQFWGRRFIYFLWKRFQSLSRAEVEKIQFRLTGLKLDFFWIGNCKDQDIDVCWLVMRLWRLPLWQKLVLIINQFLRNYKYGICHFGGAQFFSL